MRVYVTTRSVHTDTGPVVALRQVMDDKKVSTRELEAGSGVSRSTLSKITQEPGGSIEKRKAQAVAEALGVRYDDLFISKEVFV